MTRKKNDRRPPEPKQFTLETAFASVKPKARTKDLKTVSRAARDDKVRRERG